MDIILFRFINNFAGTSLILDALGKFASSGLIWAMLIGLFVLFTIRGRLREQRHELVTIIIAGASGLFAYIINYLISLVYFRPRPFAALLAVHQLIMKTAAEKSFPSDHAALAFAIAVAVCLAHRRWGMVFLASAVLVALGRIFVGVHYPSDVVAGAIVGGGMAMLVDRLARPFLTRSLNAKP